MLADAAKAVAGSVSPAGFGLCTSSPADAEATHGEPAGSQRLAGLAPKPKNEDMSHIL